MKNKSCRTCAHCIPDTFYSSRRFLFFGKLEHSVTSYKYSICDLNMRYCSTNRISNVCDIEGKLHEEAQEQEIETKKWE